MAQTTEHGTDFLIILVMIIRGSIHNIYQNFVNLIYIYIRSIGISMILREVNRISYLRKSERRQEAQIELII